MKRTVFSFDKNQIAFSCYTDRHDMVIRILCFTFIYELKNNHDRWGLGVWLRYVPNLSPLIKKSKKRIWSISFYFFGHKYTKAFLKEKDLIIG